MHRIARALELGVSYVGISVLLVLITVANNPATSLAATPVPSTLASFCLPPQILESVLTPAMLYTPWNQPVLSAFKDQYLPTVTVTGLPPGVTVVEQDTILPDVGIPLHMWILSGTPTQLGTYSVTVTAQNSCGGKTAVIPLQINSPINAPATGTGVVPTSLLPQCPTGTEGTYPNCYVNNIGPSVSFDEASLTSTSDTATITGKARTSASVYLQVRTPGGLTYNTNPTTVVGGIWSITLTGLKNGLYGLFLYDSNNSPLVPAFLNVTLSSTAVPALPAASVASPAQPVVPTSVPATTSTSATCSVSRNLLVGSRGDDVVALQRLLIQKGLLSPDSATGYFGAMTRAAVQQLQAEQGIVSAGSETSTGYGLVGARTRAALGITCGTSASPSTNASPTTNSNSRSMYTVEPLTSLPSCPKVTVPVCPGGIITSLGTDSNRCIIGYSCKPGGPVCPSVGMPTCTGGYPVSKGFDSNGCSLGYSCQKVTCPMVQVPTSCPPGQSLLSATDQYGCVTYSACQAN